MTLTVGSLFSGIGGMDLGLTRVGMDVKWQVEIDPFCNQVLEKHWPDVKRYRDVKEIDTTELERVDVVCGGFPCQPASTAGRRKGTDDDRWLWPEFYRIIRGIRPRWVVAENVPGLLSVNAGRAFGEILRDLAQSGYRIEWDCIPASAVSAPHQRDRVWILASSMADTAGVSSGRQEEHQAHRADSEGPASRVSGSSHEMANTDGQRRMEREVTEHAARAGQQAQPGLAISGKVPDTDSQRRTQSSRSTQPTESEQQGVTGHRQIIPSFFSGLFERPIRRMADGLSQGLDGTWAQEWDSVPRIIKGQEDRVKRLKALGNAVLPQIITLLGQRILELESMEG